MKTQLPSPTAVEAQKSIASAALSWPVPADDSANARPGLRPRAPELFIGLDAHNNSIAVSLVPANLFLHRLCDGCEPKSVFLRTRVRRPSTARSVLGATIVQSHQFEGRKWKLGEHIGTGTSKDARHTIRAGFAWDKDDKRVMVGFIGQHQRNRNT